jgi:class 3 adenylate cyclase
LYLRLMEALRTLPLPDDPLLAACAAAVNDAGHWAYVLDAAWRVVFATDELRLSFGDTGASTSVPVGRHWSGVEMVNFRASKIGGSWASPEARRAQFRGLGPYILATAPGGREGLRRIVDDGLSDLIEELQPLDLPAVWTAPSGLMSFGGSQVASPSTFFRIDDGHAQLAGVVIVIKPAAGMSQLAAAAATADLGHLERMRLVERADRRPAAILIADLEASSPLARRVSTAQYFAFGRRLVRAADQCILDEGGIVGRHAGDGVTAFFLAETFGSESEAARSCIAASRALRRALAEVAALSEIPEADVSMRFGLHWGATLYVGRILTAGRSEVTALGDEVNETARIEATAVGARTLASKSLVERLNRADATTLGIDTDRTTYIPLAEFTTATDKARRDAPSIAVCDV